MSKFKWDILGNFQTLWWNGNLKKALRTFINTLRNYVLQLTITFCLLFFLICFVSQNDVSSVIILSHYSHTWLQDDGQLSNALDLELLVLIMSLKLWSITTDSNRAGNGSTTSFLKADPTTIANAKRGTRFDGRMKKKKLLRKKKKGETKVTFVNLVTLLHWLCCGINVNLDSLELTLEKQKQC